MHAARLMTLHAAWKMDAEGASAARQEIALIKFYGAKVLHDVVDRALQAHGSLGYSTDLPLEQMYRFARAARLYDGPDEVHRQSVARQILRGYEAPEDGVPSEHVPTRREAARAQVRGPARGGDLQRLRRSRSSPPCSSSVGGGLVVAAVIGAFDGGDPTRRAPRSRPTASTATARSPTCATRSSSGRGRRARRRRGSSPSGCASGCRRAARARCRAACRTSSARSPGAASRSSSPPTTTPRTSPGFVGANDGAGGTAAVLEIARALRRRGRADAPPLRFVLFDGEESPDDSKDFYATGLRGSKSYARRHAKRTARDDPARLRGREGRHADPARGLVQHRAVGPAARRRAQGRRPVRPSPTRRAAPCSTTTRRSCAARCRPST